MNWGAAINSWHASRKVTQNERLKLENNYSLFIYAARVVINGQFWKLYALPDKWLLRNARAWHERWKVIFLKSGTRLWADKRLPPSPSFSIKQLKNSRLFFCFSTLSNFIHPYPHRWYFVDFRKYLVQLFYRMNQLTALETIFTLDFDFD